MAEFSKAFVKVIELEGGFVDHPDDPGGATNFGISLRWLKQTNDLELGDIDDNGVIDYQDIAKMTIKDAAKLYKYHWWDRFNYESIKDQEVANKIFDMCINMGSKQAHKLLQRAVNNSLGQMVLKDDGVLGPKTKSALEKALVKPHSLLVALRSQQEGFYRLLVSQKPSFNAFLKGWLRRANS